MNFTGLLASLWLLTLPFQLFSVVGTFSIDNLIAPLLFVFLVIRLFTGSLQLSNTQTRNLMWTSAAVFVYMISHTISFAGTQHLVWSSMYNLSKSMLYFVLPVLFIQDQRDLKRTSDLMIVVMSVGCITAMMSALGLVSFEFARVAESRIGFLPKSVGVLDSFGDMGLLISLSLLLAIGGMKSRVLFGEGSTLKVGIVLLIAFVGFVAMQSRNMVFTLIVSTMVFYLIGRWLRRSAWQMKLYVSLIAGVVFAVLMVVLLNGPLLEWVQSLGGTSESRGTVSDRLNQYQSAWSLVHDRILLGADPAVQEKYEHSISMIHNLWLKELVQAGLFGIVAILFIYLRAIRRQVAILSVDAGSLHARAYLAVIVGSLLATQFYPASSSIFWVLMGIATAAPTLTTTTAAVQRESPAASESRRVLVMRRPSSVRKKVGV